MEIENQSAATPLPPAISAEPESPLVRIFMNNGGLRAGWRLLLYVIFVFVIGLGFRAITMQVLKPSHGVFSISRLFLSEVLGFATVFGAAVIMSFIERRPIGAYGLPVRIAFGKLFWQGAALGFVEVSLLIGLIAAAGGYSFGSLALSGAAILRWAALWAICFVFVGFFEEFLFRGYSFFTLRSGIGFWAAAAVLSVLFGAVHLQNNGEAYAGVGAVVVVGLLWCFTVRRTGSLWFAVGMHAAFDFGETFVYSVPDSGMLLPGHLSNASLHGARWLTGGSVGPEASVFAYLTLFLLFLVIHKLYPENRLDEENAAAAQRTSSEANTSFTP
jgi:uncharacterized protein